MRIISLLRHLLDASYIYAQNAQPVRHWSRGYILWAILLAGTSLIAWWWVRRSGRRQGERPSASAGSGRPLAAWVMLIAGLAGVLLLVLRIETAGALSARIWSLTATAIALAAPAAYWVSRWPWSPSFRQLAKALAGGLSPQDALMPRGGQIALGIGHLAGLYTLIFQASTGLGWWPPALALGCALVAGWGQMHSGGRRAWSGFRPELLTPLALPYIMAALQVLYRVIGVQADIYQAFPYPNLLAPWFDVRTVALLGMAWTIIATGAFLLRCTRLREAEASAWLGLAALLFGVVWYGILVAVHLTRGVTASDPYCYLQMTADLAQHGSPLHDYPLLAVAQENGLTAWPIVHVGYHALPNSTLAYTDWPIGWPVLMVPFYWLGQEQASLLAAPLCALLAALLTWKLAQELWSGELRGQAWLIGGIAALITLTSNEGAARTLVPMADAAVQVFSVLMLLCLVRAHRRNKLAWSALAGVSFALAYFVRHPEITMGLAALPVFLGAAWPRRRKMQHLLVFGACALVCALPDLAYHTLLFGLPWKSESPEWFLLSWRNIPTAFLSVWREGWFARVEFGYILPLVLYGAWQQWRHRGERPGAALLTVGFVGVLGFDLFYSALRLRDLISLFPWLGLWAGRGIADLWQKAHASGAEPQEGYGERRHTAARILVLLVVLLLFFARTTWVLGMPWYPRLYIFGHLTATEYAGFTRLAAQLPPNAVVGTSVNSGAVDRYTGHQTIRPASWSDDEIVRFVKALEDRGESFYLLEDGTEIQQLLPRLQGNLALRPVGRFTLPGFDRGSQWPENHAVLYAVTTKR